MKVVTNVFLTCHHDDEVEKNTLVKNERKTNFQHGCMCPHTPTMELLTRCTSLLPLNGLTQPETS
jgi:hypothetical protein